MKAEIIAVGTEILLGNIVDTNSQFVAKHLKDLGIQLYHIHAVGDNRYRLQALLKQAMDRSDLIITIGGLGPTYDDITKEAVAAVCRRDMVVDAAATAVMHEFFEQAGLAVSDNNIKQTMIPVGGQTLHNPVGLAPGVLLEDDRCTFVMLPGPPRELMPTFTESVMPYLSRFADGVLYEHVFRFYGIGESQIDDVFREEMMQGNNPTLAPYAKDGEVELRLCAKAQDEATADGLMAPLRAQIIERLGMYLYAIDLPDIQSAVGAAIAPTGLTLACAESCTGGLVAKQLTDVPGSSSYFLGGVCSYVNEAKMNILHVDPQTLAQHGAVSEETALEMARGARALFGSDIAVSTTGVAGPGGGTPEKPVGLVYIALVTDQEERVFRYQALPHLFDNRAQIRAQSTRVALNMIIRYLMDKGLYQIA